MNDYVKRIRETITGEDNGEFGKEGGLDQIFADCAEGSE